ncbi:MAG: hypothetical protein AAGA48_19230 [Myxococcota bacterium]
MGLETLLALVTFGIGIVMLVTHLLGGTRLDALDETRARRALIAERPDANVERCRLVQDGTGAVFWLSDGRIGVVIRVGDHPAVRIVEGHQVASLGEDRIRIHFNDVGWPPRELHLNPEPRTDDA